LVLNPALETLGKPESFLGGLRDISRGHVNGALVDLGCRASNARQLGELAIGPVTRWLVSSAALEAAELRLTADREVVERVRSGLVPRSWRELVQRLRAELVFSARCRTSRERSS